SPAVRVIAAVYWPLAAAIYLTRSFGIGDWQIRWITWPIADALYVAPWGMNMALVGDRADADPRAPAAEPHLRAHQGGAFASFLIRLRSLNAYVAPPALRMHARIRLLP